MRKRSRGHLQGSASQLLEQQFSVAIRALGDYAHVTVRQQRGLLYVYVDDPEHAVARFHPLSDGTYGLSFHHHSGRWDPMPFSGDLTQITAILVQTLGPYLAK